MTVRPDPTADLARLWRGYARKVYGDDYPLYRELAAAVAGQPEVLELVLGCRPEAHDPNMLLASIQYLVMGGADGMLADLYAEAWRREQEEGGPVPAYDVGDLVGAFCSAHRDEIVALLDSRHVQTNETGRCCGLGLGLAAAADRIGEPIAFIDDGASAGLNLHLDEYLLDFGAAGSIGPTGSEVRLPCQFRGGVVPQTLRLPAIERRLGIDRAPVDLDDEEAARWMLACIWPGTGRQARARAAMKLQAGRPSLVRQGDMVTDLARALAEMRPHPTVVVTSWSFSYLPLDTRTSFVDVLADEGRRRPVAWVCCDLLGTVPMFVPNDPQPAEDGTPSVLGLAVFDAGAVDATPLAVMHSHGTWLTWLGQ